MAIAHYPDQDCASDSALCPCCGRPSIKPPEPREQLYSALVSIRNTELSVYWTRYNIQAGLNLGFAVFAVKALIDLNGDARFDYIRLGFGLAGFVLALIWLGFTVQGKKLFTIGWENWIVEYEANWLRTHYDSDDGGKTRHGPLLFYRIKQSGKRSPIRTSPLLEDEAGASREPAFYDWLDRLGLAWENLNLLARALPLLFLLAWGGLFIYSLMCTYKSPVGVPEMLLVALIAVILIASTQE